MSLLPFFEWAQHTIVGRSIAASLYAFAIIECVHLVGLAVLGGAALLVDLRLLGFAFKDQPVHRVARVAQPWLIGGLLAMVMSGTALWSSLAASKYYVNEVFWYKMYFLLAAVIFTFSVRQRVAMNQWQGNSGIGKLVACVSMFLWIGVGVMGRAIAFI
jgi:hypothetical protein